MRPSFDRAVLVLVVVALTALSLPTPGHASSHREAPSILGSPQIDGTDFYMFRSYEPGRDGFVTLVANYNPLQDPYGGPNYFPLDDNAVYDIHVENDGDGIEDLTFRFKFSQRSPFLALPVGGANVAVPVMNLAPRPALGPPGLPFNRLETYTVRVIRGAVDDPGSAGDNLVDLQGGGTRFVKPFDNIGDKTFPNYAAYANRFIYDVAIPGCGAGRLFAGQRKESFAVNLGEIFDLINLNPVGPADAEPSSTADKNITSLALEVPIDCLTDDTPVVGGWTTASLPRTRILLDDPTFEQPELSGGDLVQVSRLGMPLVNEVVIGLPDKNLFNASRPANDGQFATYVTNPTLAEIIQILFGVQAPNNFPRQDLLATFITGINGLNDLGFGEMQRLNTAIPPTARNQQDRYGVLGGDNAGFPNGRRPGDDVVDIELRVVMGVLCHVGLGLCDPADAPDGVLPYTDQTLQDALQFDDAFPYLTTPIPGSPNR